ERLTTGALRTLVGEGPNSLVANAGPYAQNSLAAMSVLTAPSAGAAATLTRADEGFVLTNEHLRVRIDETGLIESLVVCATGRETIAPGERANLLQLHRDTPTQWDAWDIDEHYRRHVIDLTDVVR